MKLALDELQFINRFLKPTNFVVLMALLVRVLMYLQMHPRTGVMISTMKYALDDLFHFILACCLVFAMASMISSSLFGSTATHLASPALALVHNFKATLSGEFSELGVDTSSGTLLINVFTIVFFLVVWVLLLNMFLAIVVDAYENARQNIEDLKEERNLVIDVLDATCYNLTSLVHQWPSREKILEEITITVPDGVIRLEDLVSGGYGFPTRESAESWYRWQCNFHSMCLAEENECGPLDKNEDALEP